MNLWVGNNYQLKDLKEIIRDLGVKESIEKQSTPSPTETSSEWKRLAGFMRGLH